ncbi:F0F1 ATP synthase subunit gamma [Aurantimonas sp. VKM B-3413]|uniref:F0F1 ATP synthase subunit gamma n=1 Tax=Aurantimonas sp. VKM B-3413 TaxID=2779401 RepID=UPI001E4854FF|nr:FoF1 ATP synthase subunit gamma [Aurantimonas sp. VKM B-3413]MCB8839887.1 F0F1 ATP synthase subunit gamma [Aurantimonas sp. VKM B-3413]
MSERLADVAARIDGIRQLGSVVNAMRGIAGARIQKVRQELAAVDAYSETIAETLGRVLAIGSPTGGAGAGSGRIVRIVFCAEQGFAGAFSERVLDAIGGDAEPAMLFLIGTRGHALAQERGITADFAAAMPSHSAGVPKLAGDIVDSLAAKIAKGRVDRAEAVYAETAGAAGLTVVRRPLLPLDPHTFAHAAHAREPILNLPVPQLLADLTMEYLHALICGTALHAFAAENQARMAAMASAHREIDRQLGVLQASYRHVRQEQITAEIVELAGGQAASRERI